VALLAHRLAPVQIAHLGYPGTIGAPFVDYLVADKHVIPPEQRAHYCESLLMLPGTFQPNDNLRPVAPGPLDRAAFGLPERRPDGSGFVFCCFNNTYKIGPAEWDVWMRLLAALPGSVLWLTHSAPQAKANLAREAAARGIDPARLVFAERVDHPVHLARHGLADLFLDTFNYNAHTTASDALWGGLPVLTMAGRGFAARVAASVLHAADLPELITNSVAEYEALALALARDPKRLGAIRDRLALNRESCALFDTARYTRNLEAGFTMAAERHRAGLPPADLVVTDCGEGVIHGE
jgi:predicted O-linked N-acetylglucosamine transferase (SPINDLY family)